LFRGVLKLSYEVIIACIIVQYFRMYFEIKGASMP